MTAPSADSAREGAERQNAEVDVWWGSYAGRAMLPSFALCVALTAAIYFGVRWCVPVRGWQQLAFASLTGAVWLVQLARWGHRFFTWNYRLTTRFLYVDRGFRPLKAQRIALPTIEEVAIRCKGLENWLGIGDLWISFNDKAQPPVLLKALVGPRTAAVTIRETVKKAHETMK